MCACGGINATHKETSSIGMSVESPAALGQTALKPILLNLKMAGFGTPDLASSYVLALTTKSGCAPPTHTHKNFPSNGQMHF